MKAPRQRARNARRLGGILARVALTCLLLGLILSNLDLVALGDHLLGFDPIIGCLMLLVNGTVLGLFALRWRLVAAALGIRAPYGRFLRGVWLGAFFSQFGPGLILNEVTRFRVLLPYGTKGPLATSQFLDRLSGQIALLGLILLLTPYYGGLFTSGPWQKLLLMTGLLALLGGLMLLILRRVHRFIGLPPGALASLLHPQRFSRHYGCSLAAQLLLVVDIWLAAMGLGHENEASALALAAPLVLVSLTLLPLSLADWGSREAAALLFFSGTGLTVEEIVALSVAYGAAHLLSALPGGLLLLSEGSIPALPTRPR